MIRHVKRNYNTKNRIKEDLHFKAAKSEGDSTRVVEVEGNTLTSREVADFARAILGDNYEVFDCDYDSCDIDIPPADMEIDVFDNDLWDDCANEIIDDPKNPVAIIADYDKPPMEVNEIQANLNEPQLPSEEEEEKNPPRDMINGKLVPAKDPSVSEIDIDDVEDEEEVEIEEKVNDDESEDLDEGVLDKLAYGIRKTVQGVNQGKKKISDWINKNPDVELNKVKVIDSAKKVRSYSDKIKELKTDKKELEDRKKVLEDEIARMSEKQESLQLDEAGLGDKLAYGVRKAAQGIKKGIQNVKDWANKDPELGRKESEIKDIDKKLEKIQKDLEAEQEKLNKELNVYKKLKVSLETEKREAEEEAKKEAEQTSAADKEKEAAVKETEEKATVTPSIKKPRNTIKYKDKYQEVKDKYNNLIKDLKDAKVKGYENAELIEAIEDGSLTECNEEVDEDMSEEDFLEAFGKKIAAKKKELKKVKSNYTLKEDADLNDLANKDEILAEVKEDLIGQDIVHRKYGQGVILDVLESSYSNFGDLSLKVVIDFADETIEDPKILVINSNRIGSVWELPDEVKEVISYLTDVLTNRSTEKSDQRWAEYEAKKARAAAEHAEYLKNERRQNQLKNWDKNKEALQKNIIKKIQSLEVLPRGDRREDFYYALGWLVGGHLGRVAASVPDFAEREFRRKIGLGAEDRPNFIRIVDTTHLSPAGWIKQWGISLSISLVKAKDESKIPVFISNLLQDSIVKTKINNNQFVYTLLYEYGFDFGDLQDQDLAKIESRIPEKYLQDYLSGHDVALAEVASYKRGSSMKVDEEPSDI